MKKITLLLILILTSISIANAESKLWRYRGEVKLSGGTQCGIIPSVLGASTSHGAIFKERLFIGVETGVQVSWWLSDGIWTMPAFMSIEGRFPFKKHDRIAFLLGCNLGGLVDFAPWEDGNYFAPGLKIPLGFEFRLKDNRCAFAVMLEVIPASFRYRARNSGYVFASDDLGARLSLCFRF